MSTSDTSDESNHFWLITLRVTDQWNSFEEYDSITVNRKEYKLREKDLKKVRNYINSKHKFDGIPAISTILNVCYLGSMPKDEYYEI